MKKYSYVARDKTGAKVNGVLESANEKTAVKTLHDHELLIISLSEKRSFDINNLSIGKQKVPELELANFTRLLSTMLGTGLPLTDALSNLAQQTGNKYFKEIISAILRDVQGGTSLSESISRYPNVFSNLYINLTKAGEASGKVGETMERLAETMESNLEFKGKIKGAMIYPAIIVIAMSSIAVFMIVSIIPKIADVYKQFDAELPLPTQIFIGISKIITDYTLFLVIFLILAYFGYKTLRKNPVGDLMINNFMFKFPIMGKMNVNAGLAVMCRTMATLLASGVSIIDALDITSRIMDNNWIRSGINTASVAVEKGLPFSLALKRDPNFPTMMSQLIGIGEETGTVDQSLSRLSKFYGDAAERSVKNLTTAMEPLMLILMGVMIGGLAIAVLLPMFNLVNVIK